VPVLAYIIVAVAAYLLGSIPTGFLVARAKGIDIQKSGSGNIGATNAMRVLGKPAGIFVMLVDAAKGWFACYFGMFIYVYISSLYYGNIRTDADAEFVSGLINRYDQDVAHIVVVAGIFAVLGHNYTCWLKFKGGKGIATTAGVYLALAPAAMGVALAVFILTVLITRYVSLGSIVAAIVLPVAVWFTKENLFLEIVTIALCALAIYKHKSNIKRLMAGTESRLGKKSEDAK
jgi:acyl phosphate:glycerol-3-phosphate acyltransferase